MPFERKGKGASKAGGPQYPQGTKPSVFNGQLLCSSGVPDLDVLTGGGLPLGTLSLLEEDVYGHYSDTFVSSFMAEGIACKHVIICIDTQAPSYDVAANLPYIHDTHNPQPTREKDKPKPKPVIDPDPVPPTAGPPGGGPGADLKIAWQYKKYATQGGAAEASPIGARAQKKPTIGTTSSTELSFHQKIQPEMLKTAKFHRIAIQSVCDELMGSSGQDDEDGLNEQICMTVLQKIQEIMATEKKALPPNSAPLLFRIVIPHFGDVNWCSTQSRKQCENRLIYQLRGMARTSHCVCLIGVNKGNSNVEQLRHICDVVLELASWDGSGIEGVSPHDYQEYTGRVDIHKLPRLNSMVAWNNGVLRLGFRVRSTGAVKIARFTLAPEVSRDQENKQAEKVTAGTAAAGAASLEW